MIVWSEIPPHGYHFYERIHMSEEQNNTQPAVTQMTAEEFVNKFHKDINYAAETEMAEDKEGDYEHRGIGAYLSLKYAASEHPEIQITDLREVLNALKEDESHPVCEQIYSEPIEEEEVVEEAPKPKKKTKKKDKKPKAKKKPAVVPLENLTCEEFDKIIDEQGEEAIFKMYKKDIKEYAEWIWREQDGEEYDMPECIEQAQSELLNGTWGPREEE